MYLLYYSRKNNIRRFLEALKNGKFLRGSSDKLLSVATRRKFVDTMIAMGINLHRKWDVQPSGLRWYQSPSLKINETTTNEITALSNPVKTQQSITNMANGFKNKKGATTVAVDTIQSFTDGRRTRSKAGGIVGIRNMGNSCFMNSIWQVFLLL
jgi:hypothetical protein